LVGLLRALAEDYGALVFMDRLADTDQTECTEVILIDHHHPAGTSFELAASSWLQHLLIYCVRNICVLTMMV
jgi:hypothetical protein